MSYHQTLSLPFPLITEKIQEVYDIKNSTDEYYKLYSQVDKFLSPELLETLAKINLRPDHFMIFGTKNKKMQATRVHTDLLLVNKNWVKVPMAINWELTPGASRWSWWDTKDLEPIYPPLLESTLEKNQHPVVDGIYYNKLDPHDTTQFSCLDTYIMPLAQPVLLRSDVPHKINYVSTVETRMCFSLRITPDKISSWDDALKRFETFFV